MRKRKFIAFYDLLAYLIICGSLFVCGIVCFIAILCEVLYNMVYGKVKEKTRSN